MSKAVICPTVTEYDLHAYRQRMEEVEGFAKRVHIDLMDGFLAPTKSPPIGQIWFPANLIVDVHLMYKRPMDSLGDLIKMKPHLVVIHAEAEGDLGHMATHLRENGIKAGLALLQDTSADSVKGILSCFDHALIFSGDLGKHQGVADLGLLDKARQLRALQSSLEISWDGGVNDQNAKQLADGGIAVLNVGGYIAGAEDPKAAYAKLESAIS